MRWELEDHIRGFYYILHITILYLTVTLGLQLLKRIDIFGIHKALSTEASHAES